MLTLDEYLDEAGRAHGHMCAGQVLGVRMAMAGCREIGIDDPKAQRKSIIAFVEIDRCAADAVSVVTGCRLGKRALKYFDYGKLAATLYNTKTGEAVRIAAKDSSREKARDMYPELPKKEQQLKAYKELPDEELFTLERVKIKIPPEDEPGPPKTRVICEGCGEAVNDKREVVRNGKSLCRACANGAYYEKLDR
ncbi:MAG TPA: FmdE family protein [Blastocatellia bacterium]|nr:FmdE family protein [Blastocatellia bacterium]